jgi:glycogen debranching enzyme
MTNVSRTIRRGDFSRGVIVQVRNSDTPAVFANGKIIFPVAVKAGGQWHACLLYDFIDGNQRFAALPDCHGTKAETEASRHLGEEREEVTKLRSSWPTLDNIGRQAVHDMVALRLHVPGTCSQPIAAAGVPWFLSLFGRDSIIASLQYQGQSGLNVAQGSPALICAGFARAQV